MANSSERVTITQLLVPMSLMGFIFCFFFMFQMSQIMRDRDVLHQAYGQQETAFQESQKLNTQFGGLVVGTQKLAKEGNASAVELEKRLKQIGVIQEPAKSAASTAPVPVAKEINVPGPVKP